MAPILSDKVYDVLKWITTIVLPAIGTFYFALSGIWGFPYGEQVVGTITAIVTLLGAILGISTYQYNKAQSQLDEIDYVGDVEEDSEVEDEHDA